MAEITELQAEHVHDGVVGVARPRLSWQVSAGAPSEVRAAPGRDSDAGPAVAVSAQLPGWRQTAWQARVRRAGDWQVAERQESAEQVLLEWPFAPLRSRECAEVSVRVWGPDGEGGWSEPLRIEAGLLERSDWVAALVRPPRTGDDECAYLRREFDAGQVVRARLYATAQGVYDCRINGREVGTGRLAPGWTSYRHRLRYQVCDVTDLLRPGANAIAVRLADGWFAGRLGWWQGGRRHNYGERTGLVAQLELTLADGSVRTIATDGEWRAGSGGIVRTSFYDGEEYAADLEPAGWEEPGFDDSGWSPVELADLPAARLTGPQFPTIEVTQSLPVREWLTSPSGARIADFGQVVTGHVRLKLRGAPGASVTVRVAEVLDGGELALRPQRTARNTDRVTLGASGEADWRPGFTFRSFRYAALEDPAGVVVPGDVRAEMVRNSVPRTGWFECSDEELNRLHENAVWGIGTNMLDVPTDCMLRDERLGWIGDAAHVAATAAFLYDTSGLLDSWLEDLTLDQRPNGSPTMVVPDVPLEPFPGDYPVAIFGDAACMAPASAYERFGDAAMLRRQLPSMAAWARCVGAEVLAGFPTPGFQFGDWLDPSAPPDNPEDGLTEYDVVMALGAIRSASLALAAARTLGEAATEAEMAGLLDQLRTFFDDHFVTKDGLIAGDSQTAYALALAVDALPPAKRAGAFDRLVLLLRRRGRLQAGYPGTYALMDVLADGGRVDLAYRLLGNTGVPSWRYAVRRGATTFWERWDAIVADGDLNPGDMLSFNHPVFASIADWMHRVIGGLAPAEPGYRRMRIAPQPGGGITWAKTGHLTPYGRASVAWELDEEEFRLDVVVPPGACADVVLPGESAVLPGDAAGDWAGSGAGSGAGVTVGSGSHSFSCPASQVPRDTDTGPWGSHAHVATAGEGAARPSAPAE